MGSIVKMPKVTKKAKLNNEEEEEEEDDEGLQRDDTPMEVDDALDVSEIREQQDDSEDEEGGLRIGDLYIPPPPKPVCSTEATGPKLIITHIENENFKSYAGKQVLGPFHKCFTSIVGPNGSGKSNVIDSMLFVFGYRASKIRSKKISVLLHNSAKHLNVKSCTVSVHFKEIIDKPGTDDYEPVPNSEFVVSRTAFKDNTSFYTINGRRVQFKEVAKLLRSHGIDLDHNMFIILQGEVEQIAMMKPKAPNEHERGMLEFLEDIIGTTRYKDPLEKLMALVEQLNEERSEKLNRVKIVEREKDDLEGPMKEAVYYLKVENEMTQTKHLLCPKDENEIRTAELEKKTNEILDGSKDLRDKLTEVQILKEEKNKAVKECTKVIEDLMVRKDTMTQQVNARNQRHVTIRADMSQTNKRKKTKEQLVEEKSKLSELEHVPEKNEKEIVELSAREEKLSKDLEKENAVMEKAMAGLKAETQELQGSKDQLQTQLMGLRKTEDVTKSAYDIAKEELNLYVSKEQKENLKLEQIRQNYVTAKNTVDGRKDDIAELNVGILKTELELQEAKLELTKVRQEEVAVSAEVRKYRAQVEETKSSRSHNHVLNSLMEQKRLGHLPGIFGRLGDLGAVDQKYDVAVSIACGPLDNIVVDTVTTGQKCIEVLKRNAIGKATFIALEKQEHLRSRYSNRINPPEGVPRLFDLICVEDDRVRPAFYYALRDTLVANNLDQATRIAYGHTRYRVVTLEGHLIDIAGTMSGGGKTVMSGRIGQSVTVVSTGATAMEQRLQELESRARQLRTRQVPLEDNVSLLTQLRQTMRMDLNKFKMEIEFSAEQQPILEKQLKQQEAKLKAAAPDPAQVKKLTKSVEEMKEDYDRAATQSAKVDAEVQELHKQIMGITGGRMKSAQNKVDEVMSNLDKVRKEITKLRVSIETSETNSKKSKEKIVNMEQEVEQCEKQMRSMQAEIEIIETDGKKDVDDLKIISDTLVTKEEGLATLKDDMAEVLQVENKLKAKQLEVHQKVENINKDIHENNMKILSLKRQFDGLNLQEIPGEEVIELKMLSIEEIDVKDLQYNVSLMETKLKTNQPNIAAINEYKQKETLYLQRVAELEKSTELRNEMRKKYDTARKNRLNEFMRGFSTISSQLKKTYQKITVGGDAELELVDSLDPFSEGINFSVRPPKKTWKMISNLSGGERTLSSLALVFALHYYKPTPLYWMDEIDAALDFKNVSIVGHYIKERAKNAQFIIICTCSNMFELADRLVGIFKIHNCTHSVTINPKLYGNSGMPAACSQSSSQVPVSHEEEELRRKTRIRDEPCSSSSQQILTDPH